MKLEDQLILKEQAKKLKELGVTADAIWYWVYPKKDGMISTHSGVCHREWAAEIIKDNEGDEFDHEICPAYSVAELGLMLPDLLETNTRQYELVTIKESNDEWLCRYVRNNDMLDTLLYTGGSTEAESRANMLIEILVKKWCHVELINASIIDTGMPVGVSNGK